MADYEAVARGSLKLKGVSDHSIKKKKKKKKDKEKEKEIFKQITSTGNSGGSDGDKKQMMVEKRTKAEIAADKAREQRRAEAIIEKAGQTHKERIMDFNRHLDTLTEHFDIPKVSWTK